MQLCYLLAVKILAGLLVSLTLGFLICKMVIISIHNVVVNFKPYHNLCDMLGSDLAT